jgi:hypothetical protein
MRMRYFLGAAVLLGSAALLFGNTAAATACPPTDQAKPRVEVVFCLDTTGSMTGLIDGAKQKIWSICNKIASGKPTPDLKVGLVAYRDRGDVYITKIFDLSDDLDAMHAHLMTLQADGGGDEPESVNEALQVALHKISWSINNWSIDDLIGMVKETPATSNLMFGASYNSDNALVGSIVLNERNFDVRHSPKVNVLRIIYLVGDAPPHMDYPNDIPYTVTCKEAAERGIIINTIQCGDIQTTTPFWQEIARKAEGRFVKIAQDGGVQQVSTPYDARLAEINAQLVNTSVVYGDASCQAAANGRLQSAAAPMMAGCAPNECAPFITSSTVTTGTTGLPTTMPPPPTACATVAADRAGYCARTGQVGAWDLVDNIKAGRVKLEDLKTEELPPAMQKLSLTERKAYLAKVESDRAALQTEARELDRKRSEHIEQELRKTTGQSGFDGQVLEMLRDQAKKIGVAY